MSPEHMLHKAQARLLLLTFLAGLAGCTKYYLLFDDNEMKKLVYTHDTNHHIVYFEKTFLYLPDGKLTEKTHEIVRIGDNPLSHMHAFMVGDEPTRKLISVEGRVLHGNGSSEKYSSGDFFAYNISDRQVISDESIRGAAIEKRLTPGDLVETVSVHELAYPDLGISFSLNELEYSAENITCCIESNRSDEVRYRVVNDQVTPSIIDSVTRKIVFHWTSYREPKKGRGVLAKLNGSPTVVAVRASQSWKSYGDWYVHLIAPQLLPDHAFIDSAARIVAGKLRPKEQMDAIYEYCQRNVRYEAVYLKQGALVPHHVSETLTRKFGDCKDYSCLMYALAVSVGLRPQLALCHRGRGVEFYDDMPGGIQFNHLILHFTDGGKDYWYDGTNRVGIPGITSFDLANCRALILEEKHSRLSVIDDVTTNKLAVTGSLSVQGGSDLHGELTAVFSNQFAVDLFWLEYETNKEELSATLKRVVKGALNENIQIDSLHWYSKAGSFVLSMACTIPNCMTLLNQKSWFSIARILPGLLPTETEKEKGVYFFPNYNRVSVSVAVSGAGNQMTAGLDFQLPAGPFTSSSGTEFLAHLDSVNTAYNMSYALPETSR